MPQPEWAAVVDTDELQAFLDAHGGRAVVKTPRGGYDGKGVRVVSSATEVDDWFAALAEDARGGALLAEELVDFSRELAQQVARRPSGQMRAYPVVETVQRDGVCAEVIAPAPRSGGTARRGRGADRPRHRRGPGRDRDAGRGAVRDHRRAAARERTRDAPAQQRALESGRRGHEPVRAASARRARPAARRSRRRARSGPSWSTSSAGRPTDALDERFAAAMAEHPGAKVHTYGKAPRPGRKVGPRQRRGRRPRRRRLPGAGRGILLPGLNRPARRTAPLRVSSSLAP